MSSRNETIVNYLKQHGIEFIRFVDISGLVVKQNRGFLNSFATENNCTVDVMPNGEHYFHTKKQLCYLENWLEKVIK